MYSKKLCNKDKYIYSAKYAEAAVSRQRYESRQGFRISDAQLKEMDELVTRLVKKGQLLTYIYAEHEAELPVSLRNMYNYIDSGKMTIRNIDLRRKTRYRQCKSFNPYGQEDITLLMNHINSTKRAGLENRAPYELIGEEDEDMKALCHLLKMDLIPPDEVHLMPDLFVFNK